MTISELELSDRIFVTARDVDDIIGCSAENIRSQAQDDPSKLGFPVVVIGNRLRIPRIPFLRFIGEDV